MKGNKYPTWNHKMDFYFGGETAGLGSEIEILKFSIYDKVQGDESS